MKLFLLISLSFFVISTANAQGVGPVEGSFNATFYPDNGCRHLIVTGLFMAPTPGYTISLSESEDQSSLPTVYSLTMNVELPSDTVPQVLTLTPVDYVDEAFNMCTYGVSIDYDGEPIILGLIARPSESSPTYQK